MPGSVENIFIHVGVSIELKSTKNLKSFASTWGKNTVIIDSYEANHGQYSVKIYGKEPGNVNNFSSLLTEEVSSLLFSTTSYVEDGWVNNTVSSETLSNLTNCSSMNFSWVNFTKLDGNDFPDSLTSLSISDCKLNSFKNLSNLDNLETLTLKNNLFSELSDFYELSKNNSLTTLDLSNNSLQNYTSVSSNGATNSYKTCDILSRFNNLTSIDLSENKDLTDFSSLTTAKNGFKVYTNNGKNKFTRNLD